MSRQKGQKQKRDFNTSKVRLGGKLARGALYVFPPFQYLKGAIRRFSGWRAPRSQPNFNTSKVRLGASSFTSSTSSWKDFNTSKVRLGGRA